MENKTALIRALNDSFRTTFIGGRVLMAASLQSLSDDIRSRALSAVREFKDFNQDNDPHGEHDFGAFSLSGEKFFWKIDYYDEDACYGSEDPSDPERTSRVLTLMMAEDY